MITMLSGVFPALVCPFQPDLSLDLAALERLAAELSAVPGVGGVVVNAHAGEGTALSPAERVRVIRAVRGAVRPGARVIAGVAAESTWESVELAHHAREAGADAIMVLPPFIFGWGASLAPDIAYRHHEAIAQAVDMPMVVFQYPVWAGCTYSPQDLERLLRLEQVVAVKEAIWEMERYETDLRIIRGCGRPVSVLAASDTLLFTSFCLGADGALIGLGNLVAAEVAQMLAAVERGDLMAARRINEQLYPLTRAIYAPPLINMHVRIKYALQVQGRLPCAAVRQPLLPVPEPEQQRLRQALVAAGLWAEA